MASKKRQSRKSKKHGRVSQDFLERKAFEKRRAKRLRRARKFKLEVA